MLICVRHFAKVSPTQSVPVWLLGLHLPIYALRTYEARSQPVGLMLSSQWFQSEQGPALRAGEMPANLESSRGTEEMPANLGSSWAWGTRTAGSGCRERSWPCAHCQLILNELIFVNTFLSLHCWSAQSQLSQRWLFSAHSLRPSHTCLVCRVHLNISWFENYLQN